MLDVLFLGSSLDVGCWMLDVNMPTSPPITVLIRTFNSGQTLDQVMAALPLAEGDEFVVVDSGSTDATLAIASRHRARVFRPESNRRATATLATSAKERRQCPRSRQSSWR